MALCFSIPFGGQVLQASLVIQRVSFLLGESGCEALEVYINSIRKLEQDFLVGGAASSGNLQYFSKLVARNKLSLSSLKGLVFNALNSGHVHLVQWLLRTYITFSPSEEKEGRVLIPIKDAIAYWHDEQSAQIVQPQFQCKAVDFLASLRQVSLEDTIFVSALVAFGAFEAFFHLETKYYPNLKSKIADVNWIITEHLWDHEDDDDDEEESDGPTVKVDLLLFLAKKAPHILHTFSATDIWMSLLAYLSAIVDCPTEFQELLGKAKELVALDCVVPKEAKDLMKEDIEEMEDCPNAEILRNFIFAER